MTENPRVAVSLSNGNVAVVNVDSALSLSIDREFVAHDLFGEPTEVVFHPSYDYFFGCMHLYYSTSHAVYICICCYTHCNTTTRFGSLRSITGILCSLLLGPTMGN